MKWKNGSSVPVEECSRPIVPRVSWDDCRAKQNAVSSPC